MESTHNPSFLDKQYPNLINTKKFGDAALFLPMGTAGTDEDFDVALRCRALTHIYAQGNSSKFAADIGISATRWNNIEGSGALSKDVARQIVRKWPEVSLDWLWRGKDDALSHQRSNEFLAAYRAIVAKAKADKTAASAKRPNRRTS